VGIHIHKYIYEYIHGPVLVAARSEVWASGRSLVGIAGSNPAAGMNVLSLVECCVLSGRSLCNGLITRSEESYQLWRVIVCNQETSYSRPRSTTADETREKYTYTEYKLVNTS
jgi:hypothetical protein